MSITVVQGEAKRRSFATYDFEWYPSTLEIRICGLYDGSRYRFFTTIDDFLNALLTREYCNVWLYAHAGGLADFTFLIGWFLRNPKFSVQARFSGSAAVHVEVRSKANPKEVWIFVDSFFLLRTSLRNIMAAMGMAKGGAEDSIEQFYAPFPELRDYNELDCTGLYAAINQFQAEILALNGELMPTIASTAMRLFRRAYLQQDIQTSSAENLILREAYIASRVEVIKKQGVDLYQYDINSSFPASMTLPAPGELRNIRKTLPDSGDCFFADVTVRIPDMDIPPLPYRRAGKVFFPTGEWRQWYSGVDVRLAEEKGQIVTVHECHEYTERTDLREYVQDLYERRKVSESDFQRDVYKILLNSLYGKFGEQTEKTKLLLHPEDFDSYLRPDVRTGITPGERVNGMDGAVLVTEDREIAHEHVPFAVHITAHSRRKITEYLWQAGDAYYCDSFAADRTVVVRSPEGWTRILPMEDLWDWKERWTASRGKEFGFLPGWSALSKGKDGKSGWFPIKAIIRHHVSKEMWRLTTTRGQVEVTADHSLMVGGAPTTPADFVKNGQMFETVGAMGPEPAEEIDLFDFVSDFGYEFVFRGSRAEKDSVGRTVKRRFAVTDDEQEIQFVGWGDSPARVRRFYKRDSREFRALLRLIGAFISEGSASVSGVTSKRYLWTISQNRKEWLEDLQRDLHLLVSGVPTTLKHTSDVPSGRNYSLRSGGSFLPALFGALCGLTGSRNGCSGSGGLKGSSKRKLPEFAYDLSEGDFKALWSKLMEGDGHLRPGGQMSYTTISQELAAGISYLLNQRDIEHAFAYRPSKKSWTLSTRPSGSERLKRSRRSVTQKRRALKGEWVYDLSVEDVHTFVDGLGRVLVSNTDCIVTQNRNIPVSKELGELKLESDILNGFFFAPKFYLVEERKANKEGVVEVKWKVKSKGFSRLTPDMFAFLVQNPDTNVGELGVPKRDGVSPCTLVATVGKDSKGRPTYKRLDEPLPAVAIERMARAREMLARARTGNADDVQPMTMQIIKSLRFGKGKRRFAPDGASSVPYSIEELLTEFPNVNDEVDEDWGD